MESVWDTGDRYSEIKSDPCLSFPYGYDDCAYWREEQRLRTSENCEEKVRGIESSKTRGCNDIYDTSDFIIMNNNNNNENSKYL